MRLPINTINTLLKQEGLQLAEASFRDMLYSAVSQISRGMALIKPMTVVPTWQQYAAIGNDAVQDV